MPKKPSLIEPQHGRRAEIVPPQWKELIRSIQPAPEPSMQPRVLHMTTLSEVISATATY